MNILVLTTQDSGCGYHRIMNPIAHMDDVNAIFTDSVTEDLNEKKFDLLCFNRMTHHFDKDLNEAREKFGCKILMDIDDDWVLPTSHVLYENFVRLRPYIENNLRNADIVTCTNERIAEKVFPFNNNIHILPNAIPYGSNQFIEDKLPDEAVRIFWSGSVTHEHDIQILRNPIKRFSSFGNKIKMVIGGYSNKSPISQYIWNKMVSYFTNGRSIPFMILPSMLPENYMELYEYADIGVIPLEKGDWHSCKSNLKILECATKKIPVIVSNVEPYSKDTDAPVFWVNRSTDWFEHTNFLIKNPNARIEYGEKLHEWAKEKYDFWEINDRRKAIFESVVGTQTHI